ncbi:MAG TPA: hypothetical protein VD973_11505 [Symbiobacteriaceae bacterium]|nr:hypothetical protein [Symbiobacteriaceae bacterium]
MDLGKWAYDLQFSQRVVQEEIYGVDRRTVAPMRWVMVLMGLIGWCR